MLCRATHSLRDLGRGYPLNMSLQFVGLKLAMLGSLISHGVRSDLSLGVKDQFVPTAATPHASQLKPTCCRMS